MNKDCVWAFAKNYNGLTCSSKTLKHTYCPIEFIRTTQVRQVERSQVITFRIRIWAVCWRMVKVKGTKLHNVNSQWWEGIRKEMLMVTWVPPSTHISERNVILQVELVLSLCNLSDTSAVSHHKYALHIWLSGLLLRSEQVERGLVKPL